MRIYKLLSVAFVFLSVFSGCYKAPMYNPAMVAKIDSLDFSAQGAKEVIGLATKTTDLGTTFSITGATSIYTPGTRVQPVVEIDIPLVKGTYTIGVSCSAKIYTSTTGAFGTTATSGQITVTTIDAGKVEGNFNFVCAGGQVVKDGQFNCNIPNK